VAALADAFPELLGEGPNVRAVLHGANCLSVDGQLRVSSISWALVRIHRDASIRSLVRESQTIQLLGL